MRQGLRKSWGPGAEALGHAETRLITPLGEGRCFSPRVPQGELAAPSQGLM